MYLFLVEWGQMSHGKPPFRWQVKKQEYVWAENKAVCREWARLQDNTTAIRTDEVFAALKVPEMDIYTIEIGKKL